MKEVLAMGCSRHTTVQTKSGDTWSRCHYSTYHVLIFVDSFQDTMSHLGAFAAEKTPGQVGSVPFDARIVGVWEGNTSKALGGYRQRIEFHNETWQRFSPRKLLVCIDVHVCSLSIIKYESFINHSESNVHLIGIYCSPISCKWIAGFGGGCLH